jgi:predicted phosphodiesterase
MTKNKEYQEIKQLVLDKANQYKKEFGYIKWKRIKKIIDSTYPEHDLSYEAIRAMYRRNYDEPYKETKNKYARVSMHKKSGLTTLRKMLLQRLKTKSSLQYLVDVLPVDRETIYAEVTRMELDGHVINKWTEDGKQYLQLNNRRFNDYKHVKLKVSDSIKILVISDTHIGHKKSEIAFMQEVIRYAYDQGVKTVLHVGDLVDGNYLSIRPQSLKELDAVGFDEQLALLNESLPTYDGLQYFAITGNHDWTHERQTFANIGKTLEMIRDDFNYLGHNFGKITIGNVDIALVHPTDGIAQNYGLKIHRYIERAGADKQARIVLMGHYHKHTHVHYKGIDGFIVPAMVSQSVFMKDNNLANVVGAFTLELKVNSKGELVSLTPEYIWK